MIDYPSLKGRSVLVTGGSRGLGKEMAFALLEAGACVAITGSRDSQALEDTIAEATRIAGSQNVLGLAADVSDYSQCEATVRSVIAAFGKIDVLINNAGVGMRLISETFNTQPTKFWEADPQAWAAIVATNINGTFNMARAAVPHMVTAGFGKVINISTSDQTIVRKGYAPYGPTKAALEATSRIWAQDLAGTGVDVNVYLPGGAADTGLLPDSPDKKGADGNLLPASIMRRAILWLCADQSNGQTGGRYIARLWDDNLAPAEAAEAARSAPVAKPMIM
ncbi:MULTISPECIES: SDR family NAD(P)-dependent oxidoreductase [Agrobacterium]|uniref:3-oxoacyl-[acyl-carrier-protein] reductase FabG n=1 Tax=Agrobacterium rosae TaxID=1972867 RepID=A0A1R3TVS5_9HYPH|nr:MULTISPECIES: SDR family oxidoreductase [Agrobacterium]KAA3511638.1 SDR family oxidoreductase [Agrobacterium rosae]KAA3518938.1 SDR family oxidoreductase [Agrobacterium rosae]MBN7806764.1 SDR family oxidoreductase [Agrobacterium rosae]MCM2435182.1 SDR family oxidoreductase [Agrobacterium rosae]MDX8314180.1 SDR family oxidoreductase [Agrobacterium rosae]